jgi:hypothetical protein
MLLDSISGIRTRKPTYIKVQKQFDRIFEAVRVDVTRYCLFLLHYLSNPSSPKPLQKILSTLSSLLHTTSSVWILLKYLIRYCGTKSSSIESLSHSSNGISIIPSKRSRYPMTKSSLLNIGSHRMRFRTSVAPWAAMARLEICREGSYLPLVAISALLLQT